MAKPKVYFTKDITPENVVRLYEKLGVKLPGKVAVKVHSGEALSSSATPPTTAHETPPRSTRS